MSNEENILAVLEALGCGGLILDRKGIVLQANDKARRYLGSKLDIGHRSCATKDQDKTEPIQLALRQAVRAATRVLPQLGNYIVVPRPDSRPLVLRSIVMPTNPPLEGAPTVALLVLDMEECPHPNEELLRDVFLLTPAEIRLARRLCCGDSLEEIADAFNVKISTIRMQLKAVFAKTGTSRQAELVAILTNLARLNSE